MSGGSLNYLYSRVEDAADTIRSLSGDRLFLAFADHLVKVSKALHDVEWVLSGDYSVDGADVAIRAVIGPAEILESATARAESALEDLRLALEEVRS